MAEIKLISAIPRRDFDALREQGLRFEGNGHCHTSTTEREATARAAPAEPDLTVVRTPTAARDVAVGETIHGKPCIGFGVEGFTLGEVIHRESKAVATQTQVRFACLTEIVRRHVHGIGVRTNRVFDEVKCRIA